MWIPDDVALTSVEEKRAFYHRELAPGKLRSPRGSLKDHNKDGSIDWRDLTVHSERIYQLRDTDGDGKADKITVFAEGFNSEVTGIAAGILYHDGWVYTTIAPDLWRLKDTNDDGVADIREVVAHGFGMHIAYAGHDMHGPRLGPDGRIYWSIGDKGINVTSKEGKRWYYPHEGAVMRVEPDGTGFEVFAHGLRNIQEIAFDQYGNMFGVDNDADMQGEQERFVYITERSDSGWRCSHQYMKGTSRWLLENVWKAGAVHPLFITPPLANYSNGPAGFAYEPGTAMGAGLRGQFILNQFPSGKMDAFAIESDGTAFKMTHLRTINNGIMGIGLSWGPDGALYMADWIGGYPLDEKGAVWRVDDPAGEGSTERKETQALLSAGFAQLPVTELQTLLSHADQRVRVEASLALAKQGKWSELLTIAQNIKSPQLARIHAVWGLGIGLRQGKWQGDNQLSLLLGTDKDAELQSQIAKVLGDAGNHASETDKKALTTALASESFRVRFQAAIALGKLTWAAATPNLLKMAQNEAADPWQRHAVVTGLAGCATSDALAALASSPERNLRLAALLALSRQGSPAITAFLKDADPALVDETARAIHDDTGIPEALPALAAMLDQPGLLPNHTARRAINANLRLGGTANAARLLKIALTPPDSPEQKAQSLDAFSALLNLNDPPRLDRIDGMAHPYAKRNTSAIAAAIQPSIQNLLALSEPEAKAAAIELMVKLQLKVAAPTLQQIIADTTAKPTLRVGALKLMAAQHAADPAFTATLTQTADKSAPTELRIESLSQTFTHRRQMAPAEASQVLEKGNLTEKQAALRLLGRTKGKDIETLLDAWMQRLASGKVELALKLDVLEAAQSHEALATRVQTYQQSRVTAPRDDLLEGGSVSNGKDIVTNHLGANCLACHTVEAKEGSAVGPILTTIGGQRTRADLLESLLNPVAKIVPGYGLVSITLKDGTNLAGALYKEDATSITLRQADGTEKKLARDQITLQTPPISVMPPMLGILTPSEIRDTVAYLTSLKPKSSSKTKATPAKKPADEH